MSKLWDQLGTIIDADSERAQADCIAEHKRRLNRLPDSREINDEIRRELEANRGRPWSPEWDSFMDGRLLDGYSDGRDVS